MGLLINDAGIQELVEGHKDEAMTEVLAELQIEPQKKVLVEKYSTLEEDSREEVGSDVIKSLMEKMSAKISLKNTSQHICNEQC